MTEIISVRFKSGGKQYYFDPQGQQVNVGDGVILETSRGLEYGECTKGNHMVQDEAVVQPLRPVVRVATEKDKETVERNREKEKTALRICQEKIAEHELDMKLVDAEYSFEGNKVLFFFTSEGRVDFRALVKDLASALHARIELRQIGVRDEAKMLGGLGICGKPFCCAQFLDEFQPVSIKMAKTQNLSLNPTKISGTCGRLMCCLKYEQDAYEDAVKRCPKQESFVETPDGVGTVTGVNLLREQVKVRLEDSTDAPKSYSTCEICVVRNGKGKRPEGYVAPPPEELAKLRKTPIEEEPRRLGERSPFIAALDGIFPDSQIAAANTPAQTQLPEQKPESEGQHNHSGRRHRRGGARKPQGEKEQPKEQQTQVGKPKQPQSRQNQPKPNQPKQGQGKQVQKKSNQPKQKGIQPQKQPQENIQAKPTGEGGEKKSASRRRRWRPRHKKEGGQQPKTEG